MTTALHFGLTAYQNEYLPEGGDRVDVVVRVTAAGGGATATVGPAEPAVREAEFVILLDCSGSMNDPYTKLSEARRGAAAAVAALPDGVRFAVVAGDEHARLVYPAQPALAIADEGTRAAAAAAITRLRANGGTAIGRWLSLADELFTRDRPAVRHALLLTDGKNQHETREELDAVLTRCRGRFRCDCRAVGKAGGRFGWDGAELLHIAQSMSGTVHSVADPADLPANLSLAAAVAMERALPDLRLRIRVVEGTAIRSVKQVHPTIEDLAARTPDADRVHDYATGSWGADQRDYHVAFTVSPRPPGTELRIAWVSLAHDGDEVADEAPVWARWTRDARESTRLNPQVDHYTSQTELAAAIQEGIDAYKRGAADVALDRLGRAVAIAFRAGHTEQLERLAQLVVVHDAERGTVSLRPDLDATRVESAVLESVRTGGFRRTAPHPPVDAAPAPVPGELCPICRSPAVYRYCEQDGYDFEAGAARPGSDR